MLDGDRLVRACEWRKKIGDLWQLLASPEYIPDFTYWIDYGNRYRN